MKRPRDGTIELRAYYTWMGSDGIARTQVKTGYAIVLEDAEENAKTVNGLFGPDFYPLVIDTRNIKSISKEARDFFSMRGRESRVYGFAILVDSQLSKIIGNFFMGLNRPRVPVKIFTTEKKAIEWCKKLDRPIDA